MSRRILGPFNRVEGDLEVTIETDGASVTEARINAPLYRGFEEILIDRDPFDALTIVPRICGICSVSQSVAASRALADAMGLEIAPNGRLVTELVSATENIADHLTHFYLFFMPDFARADYQDKTWNEDMVRRFQAQTGQSSEAFLKARARLLHVVGILAGKWPHTLALQPGGVTKAVDTGARMRLMSVISDFQAFTEQQILGDSLQNFAQLSGLTALFDWARAPARGNADFPAFIRMAEAEGLAELGLIDANLLSFGAYAGRAGEALVPRGIWQGSKDAFDPMAISEHLGHSWLAGRAVHPSVGRTEPTLDKPMAYSWCKAPRLGGQVMEVGALARQVMAGRSLVTNSLHSGSEGRAQSNVLSRVLARMVEVATLLPSMIEWCQDIDPKAPFCSTGTMPSKGSGVGLVEAARGSLGHWLTVHDGKISSYQIIAPTTWNFSPRDDKGVPGAAEQALVDTEAPDSATTPVAVQHVVRSFDPCMVCTVH